MAPSSRRRRSKRDTIRQRRSDSVVSSVSMSVSPEPRGEPQARLLRVDEARVPQVVPLEDVRRRSSVQRPAPATVVQPHQQQLVLEPGQRQLALVVGAERALVEPLDRGGEAVIVIGLDREAILTRPVLGDDQRARDIAPVAGEQGERVVDRHPGSGGQRLQRLALGEQPDAERRRVAGPRLQRQRAGDHRARRGPARERLVAVATADRERPGLLQLRDLQAVKPDAQPPRPTRRHRRPAA